ncbi:hypothetical protein SAMN06272759_111105 [Novosphingobium sp. B1]|nr:hypothetical protein SAMN06272759_111105 [Novosphingobium sp. B1]
MCTHCAMCCDGTKFAYVNVSPDEAPALAADFAISDDGGEPSFPQPCHYSVERRCEIYARRPITCRSYRCKTLSELRKELIAPEEARRRVDETLVARRAVSQLLQPGETLPLARKRRNTISSGSAPAVSDLRFMLALTALDLLVDRYFRANGETMFSRKAAGAIED